VTVSPAHRARITSTDSLSRAFRSGLGGHAAPVTCSFRASPLPAASQNRPGYMSARVAAAWATTAGCYRPPGAQTVPNDSPVPSRAAPSQPQANPDWPWSGSHG
jgi:hypothetical protein